MATARFARVAAAQPFGEGTRLLELVPDEPLGFVGGQYVIVDTGKTLPGGKACKRAYSVLSCDGAQDRFRLAVKRIPGGVASGHLHEVEVGATVQFSGPWGKLAPADGAAGRTLVLATDTGITAALGLVQSARFRPLAPATLFVWLEPPGDGFLPRALVREMLPGDLGEVRFGELPPVGDASRIAPARAILRELLHAGALGQAFIAGDGLVNYALLDELVAAGVAATRDSVESFFNMPKKSP
ncbi:MAG TPA: FAD-dependent oxidoreductase [Kofleriaceae bacterium]|nr:FAD-dependent oxidoreductase [Kofleriaceae bacterium]